MLAAIVRASLRNPRIVTALACLIAAFGLAALLAARFDVFPDFAPPHVLVQTEAPGLDATQVEALVTRPLEGLLAGTENVKTVRSTSSQGLSAIQVVFDRGGDPYRQRQVVTERLAEFAGLLPQGVGAPLLSPLSSSMEYLVHFGYTSDRLSPVELRDVVQWIVKPQILAVPGVAQAQIFGGEVRERQIADRSGKARRRGVHARRCPGRRQARDRLDRRGIYRDAVRSASSSRPRPPAPRSTPWRRRWSARTAACRCASATSPHCEKAPSRVSAMH